MRPPSDEGKMINCASNQQNRHRFDKNFDPGTENCMYFRIFEVSNQLNHCFLILCFGQIEYRLSFNYIGQSLSFVHKNLDEINILDKHMTDPNSNVR